MRISRNHLAFGTLVTRVTLPNSVTSIRKRCVLQFALSWLPEPVLVRGQYTVRIGVGIRV